MTTKVSNSLMLRRKYKWQLLRPLFKKRRGKRRLLQSSKILNLLGRKQYIAKLNKSFFRNRNKNINFSRASLKDPNSSTVELTSNYQIMQNAALIQNSADIISLKLVIFIAANYREVLSARIQCHSAKLTARKEYKLAADFSHSQPITPCIFYKSPTEYTNSPALENSAYKSYLKSIWKKALTLNSSLSLVSNGAGVVSSDGYLPILYLPTNFSWLDDLETVSPLNVVPSPFLSNIFSPSQPRKSGKSQISNKFTLKISLYQKLKKKLSKVLRSGKDKRNLNKQFGLLKRGTSIAGLRSPCEAYNSFHLHVTKFAQPSFTARSSISTLLNSTEYYQPSATALISNFSSLNLKKKPLSFYANNVYPTSNFNSKYLSTFRPLLTKELNFTPDISPWVNDAIIRFVENCSGKRALFQYSTKVETMVGSSSKLRYRLWIQRMSYYERNLGHRFFMEEALHIMHLSFRYHDVNLFSSWLKAIITRISFWKTRSIFRFLKYVFNNYYRFIFNELSIKGIKIRLKGKISAAGNSRKRTVLFRSGKNSHSQVSVKCIHDFKTITTFSGAMGFQVWMFY